ncbi:MAG: peptide deformylase [Planctomycetes bacterium]|nr:peptide deformylase [Planctomycetota bacterium]
MAPELHFDLTLYPDPLLRRPALPVEAFDEELRAIVSGMFERMHASKGVGLAAPQVGLKKRILVVNSTGETGDEIVLVNPRILARSGSPTLFEEGCLSFPGIYAEVERPDACRVQAFGVDGQPFEALYEGFVSRIVQHEHDHLEGVLLVDRMSPADRLRNKAALEELVAKFKRKTPTPAR